MLPQLEAAKGHSKGQGPGPQGQWLMWHHRCSRCQTPLGGPKDRVCLLFGCVSPLEADESVNPENNGLIWEKQQQQPKAGPGVFTDEQSSEKAQDASNTGLTGISSSLLKLAMCTTLQAMSHTRFHACNAAEPKSSNQHQGASVVPRGSLCSPRSLASSWVEEELSTAHIGEDKPPRKEE